MTDKTPRELLRESLEANAAEVATWPAWIRRAVSTAEVFTPAPVVMNGWEVRFVRVAPDPDLGEADPFAGWGAWLTNVETGERPARCAFERKEVPSDVPDLSGWETLEAVREAAERWTMTRPALTAKEGA